MNNQYASDKKYLELEGLKALIIKIGAMREEYIGQNESVVQTLANLLARLNHIVAAEGEDTNVLPATDDYDYSEGTLFECVAKYVQDLRNELGATETANDKTVYARLDQIEDWVNNGFVDEDGTEYAGLLNRVKKLENESFAQVECTDAETVKKTNLWEATFKNAAGDELGKIALNTSDFVVDGILDEVRLIAVQDKGSEIVDLSDPETVHTVDDGEPWKTLIQESANKDNGGRYIVFSFKTIDQDANDVTDPDKNPETPTDKPISNIWVSMHDLHDSFEFNGTTEASSAAYIELNVETTHTNTGATNITYMVALKPEVVEILDKLLGKVEGTRSYDDVNTELTGAQDDIKELQGYVRDGGFDETIENEDGTKTTITRDGLLKRTAELESRAKDLEDHVEEIEAWREAEGIINPNFVEDYFNAVVFASTGAGADKRRETYESDVENVIDKPWSGSLPDATENKYN